MKKRPEVVAHDEASTAMRAVQIRCDARMSERSARVMARSGVHSGAARLCVAASPTTMAAHDDIRGRSRKIERSRLRIRPPAGTEKDPVPTAPAKHGFSAQPENS